MIEEISPETIEEFEQLVEDVDNLFNGKDIDNIVSLLVCFLAEATLEHGLDKEELISFYHACLKEPYMKMSPKQ